MPQSPSEIIKNRYLGFLIWQSIASTSIYLLISIPHFFTLSLLPLSLLLFLLFSLSLLLVSLSLSLLSSPYPHSSASLFLLSSFLLKSLLRSLVGGFSGDVDTVEVRRRVKRSLSLLGFLVACSVSGFLGVVAVCGRRELVESDGERMRLVEVGFRGLVFGVVYGVDFVWRRRWILKFPVIQRPLFYSFKRGFASSAKQALKLSTLAFINSTGILIFLPNQFKRKITMRQFVVQLFYFYIGTSAVSICWELSHHLLQVVHTRRFSFAPPQGSAAAETNPTEVLLEALEQSNQRSLMQYLAYLDLCMVSESNVEPWRRAAIFEETGETYRRIISVCLRPLEQLTSKLGEGLEGTSVDKSESLAQQLNAPTDTHWDAKLYKALDDFQLFAWSSRTVAALTARSHREDKYGVAQLTGCNSEVVSTLLSALIAVEACLGKKTSPQPVQLMGPANIRWAATSAGKRGGLTVASTKRRGRVIYDKAYVMADVLRTSIYKIISAFEIDMQANAKASVLEKNWVKNGKPLYGSREILVQKLVLFLGFNAN